MRRSQKKYLSITLRDVEILKTLWKWKLGTTASVGYEFFGNADSDAAYQRLYRLKKFGYVQHLSLSTNKGHVWCLSRTGFATIKSLLPELREDGFLSETLDHDFWCAAFHRPYLQETSSEMELFSEQELRRLNTGCFPSWIPFSNVHRPDGYFRVPINDKLVTVALEVELNRKKDSFYHLVANFYQSFQTIFRIIWLVQNNSDARLIQEKIKTATPDHFQKHLFVTTSDFKNNLWQAPILLGREESKPLSILLERGQSLAPVYRDTPPIFDTRKRPYITKVYLTSRNQAFRDRVAVLATPYNPITQRTNHEQNTPTYLNNSSPNSMLLNQNR